MRLTLAACVSLGFVAFAACSDDNEASDSNPSPDGGASSDASSSSSSSSSGSSGKPAVDSGSGPFKEDENRPCEGRTPSEDFSVFVATSGNDTPTCGTREAPCKTVQTGIAKAYATAKPKVVVGAGTYAEALVLDGGLTIEGAWEVSGSTWTPSCSADHSSLATIQAPDTANTSVKATRGASVLRFLTIKSKPAAAPGESLYGLIVLGPNVKVALADTNVMVAAGGKGADGAPGDGTATATCAAAGDGAAGASGSDGTAGSAGTLSSTAFTSGAGGDAAPGESGHSGTAPPASSAVNYDRCDVSGDTCISGPQSTLPVPGTAGCGGGGGLGGKGGRGGGSSVGILATNAIIVTYGGSVTTGAGGVGGNGGLGADGASGAAGQVGQTSTYLKAPAGGCGAPPDCGNVLTQLAGGAAGGPGGNGGKGGQGGGGPGGWSISFAKFNGAALLASATTVFTTTPGGKGGAPNGTDGLRQQQWP